MLHYQVSINALSLADMVQEDIAVILSVRLASRITLYKKKCLFLFPLIVKK